jgi:flagellar motor switch protein FliM
MADASSKDPVGDADDDDFAAAVREALAAPAARAAPSGQPLLNQEEIDSLLGLGADDDRSRPRGGLEMLLDNQTVSYERLPMLEVVFDRLVRLMSTSLRNFMSENVEVTLERIDSMRFGDYLDSVPLPTLIAVFRASEWDNYGLVTVDSPLIYAVVDVLLGGRRGTTPVRIEGRAFTTIERNLVERLIVQVLHDMGVAFAPLSAVQFRFERLETNPRFVAIARPNNAAILFKLRLEMEERGGTIGILLPYATLEPVRDLLLQMFMGEKFGSDSIWERHFAKEMLVTQVEIEALLDEQTLPLGAVMELREGVTLPLRARPEDTITLRCGQVPLLRGRIGRLAGSVAVLVDERVDDRRGDG